MRLRKAGTHQCEMGHCGAVTHLKKYSCQRIDLHVSNKNSDQKDRCLQRPRIVPRTVNLSLSSHDITASYLHRARLHSLVKLPALSPAALSAPSPQPHTSHRLTSPQDSSAAAAATTRVKFGLCKRQPYFSQPARPGARKVRPV